jgi:acetyl esterase/lipase
VRDERAKRRQKYVLYRSAVIGARTFWSVLLRRLFKGPLHPEWDLRYEVIAGTMRMAQRRILGMPLAEGRRMILRTRVHPSLVGQVELQRSSLGGLYAEIFTPQGFGPGQLTVLYFHGGGYFSCSPATHRDLVSRIAVETGARCIAVDYRKAPEHPFPAAIDDCEAAYRALLDEGVPASSTLLAGDSAGGALVLAVLQRARDAGLPLPDAALLLSPWVDLSCAGESVQANACFDYISPEGLTFAVEHYLQGQDPLHPHVSPVHADLRGLPPMLLLTGGVELFLSENLLFAERARAHGVDLTHHIEPGMVHVWSLLAGLTPKARGALKHIGAFVRKRQSARKTAQQPALRALHAG